MSYDNNNQIIDLTCEEPMPELPETPMMLDYSPPYSYEDTDSTPERFNEFKLPPPIVVARGTETIYLEDVEAGRNRFGWTWTCYEQMTNPLNFPIEEQKANPLNFPFVPVATDTRRRQRVPDFQPSEPSVIDLTGDTTDEEETVVDTVVTAMVVVTGYFIGKKREWEVPQSVLDLYRPGNGCEEHDEPIIYVYPGTVTGRVRYEVPIRVLRGFTTRRL